MKKKFFLSLCLPLFLAVGCGESSKDSKEGQTKDEQTKDEQVIKTLGGETLGGEIIVDGKKIKIKTPSPEEHDAMINCIRWDADAETDKCKKLYEEYKEYKEKVLDKIFVHKRSGK